MAKHSTKPSARKEAPPKKPVPAAKTRPAPEPAAPVAPPATMDKPSKKSALRESILARKAATKPIAFSLDEVCAIAKTNEAKPVETSGKTAKVPAKTALRPELVVEKPLKPNHVRAASLADILGFNPKKARPVPQQVPEQDIPEKFRRYYKLLIDLRSQLTEGIERHSEESLKRSAKDDAGDLSAYGQNMADGGINTFDRDFVLSLVSSEQEALSEIDAALKRIHDGTYGTCEVTQKPIAKDRLLAVPFTRYSAEAQKEIEKNRYRSRGQTGAFAELGEDGAKLVEDDTGTDE
jgi:RNA polymerase-binding transcription factor DksA